MEQGQPYLQHNPMEDIEEKATLSCVNYMLALCSFNERVDSLRDCTVSMFVCIIEALFRVRIPGINRFPSSREHNVHNCYLLLQTLSEQMGLEFNHIHPEKVQEGDRTTLINLIEIFFQIAKIIAKNNNISIQEPNLSSSAPSLSTMKESLSSSTSGFQTSLSSYPSHEPSFSRSPHSKTPHRGPIHEEYEEPEEEGELETSLHDMDIRDLEQDEETRVPWQPQPVTYQSKSPVKVTRTPAGASPRRTYHQEQDADSPPPPQRYSKPVGSFHTPHQAKSRSEVPVYQGSMSADRSAKLRQLISDVERLVPPKSKTPSKKGPLGTSSLVNSPARPTTSKRTSSGKIKKAATPAKEKNWTPISSLSSMSSISSNITAEEDVQNHAAAAEAQAKQSKKMKTERAAKENRATNQQLNWFDGFNDIMQHNVNEIHNNQGMQNDNNQIPDHLAEDMYQSIAKKIPENIPKGVWEKPLREWVSLKVTNTEKTAFNKRRVDLTQLHQQKEAMYQSLMKDYQAAKRRQEIREAQQQKLAMRAHVEDRKRAQIKMKKFLSEREREKLQKTIQRQSKEERLYRNLFTGALHLQKARILEEKKESKDRLQALQAQHQLKSKEIHDYFMEQYKMISEELARERHDQRISEVAHKQALLRLESDLRKKMQAQLEQLKWDMRSEEDRTYHMLNQNKKIIEKLSKSPFYVPSSYVEADNIAFD